MRAKNEQTPERCKQCKWFTDFYADYCVLSYGVSWITTLELCAKYNWLEWENKLTKYDFEDCP